MANGKPIVRPGSDGIMEIQVGERTVEIKPEYLDEFVFEVEMSQEFISKIKNSLELHIPNNEESKTLKPDFKVPSEIEPTNIVFTRVETARGSK
jgi:hypothetical protein